MVSTENDKVLAAENFPRIKISTLKCKNQLELILCTVNNPLYSSYVTIPTFIGDDKGLPHTLEHLIFCGSHDYPERGYLDRLATLCQGAGTNAYTSEDHTCYTFSTSSLSGLLRLLPVFLDHIFRPRLEPAIVSREVFHRGVTGEGRGVVYCEMAAREWTEQDQLDLALRKAVFGKSGDEQLDGYRWECGGLTKFLATLELEEIVAYHRRHYRPENATIVLCGGDDLRQSLDQVIEILEATEFLPPAIVENSAAIPTVIDDTKSKELVFPATDESLGSVGFGWLGPPSNDLYLISALHVLMRMLKDTSASPLYQHFVERADPVASDIDYEIKPSYRTMISLIFSGVPTELVPFEEEEEEKEEEIDFLAENSLKVKLVDFLQIWKQDEAAIADRLQVALKSIDIKLQESLEDDPHEVVASFCMPEIIRRHWPHPQQFDHSSTTWPHPQQFDHSSTTWPHPQQFDHSNATFDYGEAITAMPQILKQLAEEPLFFWINLLETYILASPPAEVRMRPSRTMNEQIKDWERANLESITKLELDPEVAASTTPIPEFDLTVPINIKCQLSFPGESSMLVSVPGTLVKRLTMAFDLRSIAKEHLPALVLLQELLFQSDIELTEELMTRFSPPPTCLQAGRIPYQELIEVLSMEFSLFEAAVGFDNELFSTGYLDSHLVVSLHGRVDYCQDQLQALIMSVLAGSIFTIERLEEVLENLVSQLKDSWRDPSTVLDTILVDRLAKCSITSTFDNNKRHKSVGQSVYGERLIGLLKQTEFFSEARRLLEHDPQKLLSILNGLRGELLEASTIVHFSYGTTDDLCESEHSSTIAGLGELGYSLPKYGHLQRIPVNCEGILEVIPIADITASFLSLVVPLNLFPHPRTSSEHQIDNLLCTALICQLISYTEGPLYRRIRGGGLAYGASLGVALWNGLLSFDVHDCTDPIKSLTIVSALVQELLSEASIILESGREGVLLNKESLRTAQAVQLYQFVAERSTPASIVSTALRCQLRGLPPVGSEEERLWNERLLKLTVKDVATCIWEVLPAFLEATNCVMLLAVPSSRLETICEELQQAKLSFAINAPFYSR